MTEEIWVDVKGYEGMYKFSSLGKLKSLDRKVWNHIKMAKRQRKC